MRWLGIVLISGGVGFVAGGPALTSHPHEDDKIPTSAAKDAAEMGHPLRVPADDVVSSGAER